MLRKDLLALLPQADGLLLLSASYAALPSKLFEYMQTGLPIFAVTERDSATWCLCRTLSQVVLVDSNQRFEHGATKNFIDVLTGEVLKLEIPVEYSEQYLSDKFNEQ
jgi:hypothetical protein